MATRKDSEALSLKTKSSKSSASETSNTQVMGPITRSKYKIVNDIDSQHSKPASPSSPTGGKQDASLEKIGVLVPAALHESISHGSSTGKKSNESESDSVTSKNTEGRRKNSSIDTFYDNIDMPVMTTSLVPIEEQVADLAKSVDSLKKIVEDRDVQLAKLINRLESREETSQVFEHTPKVQEVKESDGKQEARPSVQLSENGSIPLDQLQSIILSTVNGLPMVSSKSSRLYVKPYTERIEELTMPAGYSPPKFQQFTGKGNPRQHVAHFVETCNNAGTEGDLLVKQFVRTLKDDAFEWYGQLQPRSIDSWGQMEQEFLNQFYSTRRTVGMIELTNTRQWREEKAIDYINRWRNLSLNCKDRLSKGSAIEMCI